jgi:hypothetical protein
MKLNTINRNDDATVGVGLCLPGIIVYDRLACSEQGAVCVKKVQHLAARDRDTERGQAGLEHTMHLINRLMFREAQVADQQDNVEPKGEAR